MATPLTPEQLSAQAIIQAQMRALGLAALGTWAWNAYKNGMSLEQIFLEMRNTDEYKARFPAMAALAKQGRAISEAEYIDYERTIAGMFHAAGLPKGFYDRPDDFATLIAGNVSPAEVGERVQLATTAVYQSDPATRAELQRLYGISGGELTAYWLDPNKALPLLQQRLIAGQVAGASQRSGFGALTLREAETLGKLGVTPDQAIQGFGALYENRQLMEALPGERGLRTIGRTEQFGAVFQGEADTQAEIERRRRLRQGQFEGGTAFAESREGYAGLGVAST